MTGPFPGFPVPLDGDDISGASSPSIAILPMSDQLPTMDPPAHHPTGCGPKTSPQLRENEEFMQSLCARQSADAALAADGRVLRIAAFASPFVMLVIADLLGVPEEDHEDRPGDAALGDGAGESRQQQGETLKHSPLEYLYAKFTCTSRTVVLPRADVLSGLAAATFPDGSLPEVIDVVWVAAVRGRKVWKILAEDRQARLRADRGLLRNFIEETLRWRALRCAATSGCRSAGERRRRGPPRRAPP